MPCGIQQKGLEGELTRRSLTHTSWDLSSSRDRDRRGWHPVTYKYSDATPELIKSIKVRTSLHKYCKIIHYIMRILVYWKKIINYVLQEMDNIYYETKYRREWCSSKGKPSTYFLFARKFTQPATLRLLNMVSFYVRR